VSTGPQGERRPDNIAAAIADVSERASLLVREEIELAKAEVTEKVTKLVKGAVVGVAAGVFFLTALFFVLIGCAWLLYYFLPVNDWAFFFGFFAMAAILVVLGVIAGVIAAKVVKRGAPPVPSMAIEEAQKIKQAVSAPPPGPDQSAYTPEPLSPEPPVAAYEPPVSAAPAPEAPAPEAPVPEAPVPEAPVPEASAEPITDEHQVAQPQPPAAEGGGLAADAIFNKPRSEGG
jgi:Putative Actinobacterial Holin-X, holin superfamily III